ncbi:hypothetical protein FRC12_016277 [Ceratobasidium sp. 428]|nr:hypothetical protein FRC12_016277 [Ceratobasidium sp. 428]
MEFVHEMELDPVQWQSTQKVALIDVFRDEPAPAAPILPIESLAPVRLEPVRNPHSHNTLKRRRLKDSVGERDQRSQDNPLDLIKRLGEGLQTFIPNPNKQIRRTARSSSDSSASLGGSVGASSSKTCAMPPPPLKIPQPAVGPSSSTSFATPVSESNSFAWNKPTNVSKPPASRVDPAPISASSSRPGSSSSSNQTTTAEPRTPPPRNAHTTSRPASVPTLPTSSLISPEQDTELPLSPPTLPRPASPPRAIRVDRSIFSTRSDSDSTTASTDSDATAATVLDDQPITPGTRRASLPIIDLTLTPTPSPPAPAPPAPAPAPKPPQTRAASKAAASRQVTPAEPARPAAPTRSAPSEPQPPRPPQIKPPVRAQTNPSQSTTTTTAAAAVTRPPSQQWPRVFHSSQMKLVSSQTRLGLGAVGKGYDAASRPFRVPSKNKEKTPLTVSALYPRGRPGMASGSGSGGSAGKASKTKSPVKSTSAGKLNFASVTAAGVPPSPTKRKENNVAGAGGKGRKEPAGRKTPTPVGRPNATRGTTIVVTRSAASSKARKEPSSDTEYLASDGSFDDDALEAAMAEYDN